MTWDLGWFDAGFWIFMIVFFIVDTKIHLQGHDTFWWSYKTDAEKEIQKIRIDNLRGNNERRYF